MKEEIAAYPHPLEILSTMSSLFSMMLLIVQKASVHQVKVRHLIK